MVISALQDKLEEIISIHRELEQLRPSYNKERLVELYAMLESMIAECDKFNEEYRKIDEHTRK